MDPSLAGFISFIQNIMGVPASALSLTDPIIQFSYDWAYNIVLTTLQAIPSRPTSPSVYAIAIYNLAADTLINYANDANAPITPSTYWVELRKSFGVNAFTGGIINFSSDEATSNGIAVSDALKSLQLLDLQQLKTPYGRAYLGIAQGYGTLWGIS